MTEVKEARQSADDEQTMRSKRRKHGKQKRRALRQAFRTPFFLLGKFVDWVKEKRQWQCAWRDVYVVVFPGQFHLFSALSRNHNFSFKHRRASTGFSLVQFHPLSLEKRFFAHAILSPTLPRRLASSSTVHELHIK